MIYEPVRGALEEKPPGSVGSTISMLLKFFGSFMKLMEEKVGLGVRLSTSTLYFATVMSAATYVGKPFTSKVVFVTVTDERTKLL